MRRLASSSSTAGKRSLLSSWDCGGGDTLSRNISSAAFAGAVQAVQSDFAKNKNRETQINGKRLFETEVIDDLTTTATSMTPATVEQIANAASVLRVRPHVGKAFGDMTTWCLRPDVVSKMPAEPLSRLLHACVILHAPALFDLLIMYLHRVMELAPKMDAVVCSVIINAYGRAGLKHPGLYTALGDRAFTTVTSPAITIAHVANMLYALSRVGYTNTALYDKLQQSALKQKDKATPLIVASILDSLATADHVQPATFKVFEQILLDNIDKLNAPLLTSVLGTLCRAKRTDVPLFSAGCKRATAIAPTFDSASVARVMEGLLSSNINNEDLLGALAERCCRIHDFRVAEARTVLETLSTFQLYDPELFPLLGGRVASIIRSRGVYDVDNVAAILAAFAAVHERHEDMIHVGSRVLSDSANSMTPKTYINALYSFAVHNIRNDLQRKLVEACRTQMGLLEAEANKNATYGNRLQQGRKAFAL